MSPFDTSEIVNTEMHDRPKNRKRLRCGLAATASALFVALLAAWALFVIDYNEQRDYDTVFDEMYWGLIDIDSASVVLQEHGLYLPGGYLCAFLNPFKESNILELGFEKNETNWGSLYRQGHIKPAFRALAPRACLATSTAILVRHR